MAGTNVALSNESMKKLMEAIAARDGVSVVYDPECKVPSATVDKKILLPPPSAIDADIFWFYAYHELSHILREMTWSYTQLAKYVNPTDDLVLAVANILVDNLSERNFFGQFEGVDLILDAGRAKLTRSDWMTLSPETLKKLEKEPVEALILGLMMSDVSIRQRWMGHNIEALPIGDFSGEMTAVRQALGKIGFPQRMEALATSAAPARECGKLIIDILNIIGYDPPPPEPQEGEGEGDGEGQGEGDGEGESQAGTESDGSESQVGDTDLEWTLDESDPMYNPDGMGDGKVPANFKNAQTDINLAEVLKALGEDLQKRLDDEPEKRDPYEYDGTYTPHPKNSIRNLEKDVMNYRPDQRAAIVNSLGTSTVSKSISKYLKALVSESYTYGQKRGKLHQKNIHKLIGNKPSPGVQPGIFKRKNSAMLKSDSAVTIQMDCSGSMSGSKFTIAAACCVALSETLTSINIPHEILGFSEDADLVSYIFKSFGGTLTKDKLISILANRQIDLYSNADGESVMFAAERLMFRKEKRKLLVVLSDGMPCGHYYGDGKAYLKHVCKTIEEESPIDLVGIGIKTTAVQRFYKDHVIVDNPSKLDSVLFGVLKNFLT